MAGFPTRSSICLFNAKSGIRSPFRNHAWIPNSPFSLHSFIPVTAGFPSRSSLCLFNANCRRYTRYSYDVFLSFRGRNMRRGFVDHLFHAITGEGLRAFVDTHSLNRGDDISATLHHAIQVSRILVPIFSTNYAQSPWCLREASLIARQAVLQRKGNKWPIVIPLFYDVTPSQVRRPDQCDSPFAKAFQEHEVDGIHSAEEIQEWKAALYEICRFSGWSLREDFNGYELALVKSVVENVAKVCGRKVDKHRKTGHRT